MIACLTSPVPERACATASRRLFTSAAPLPSLGRGPPVGASVRGGRRGPALPALGPAHRRSSLPLAICLLLATFSLRPDLPATVHALLVSPPELISLATRSARTLGHPGRQAQLPALVSCSLTFSHAMLCLGASGPYWRPYGMHAHDLPISPASRQRPTLISIYQVRTMPCTCAGSRQWRLHARHPRRVLTRCAVDIPTKLNATPMLRTTRQFFYRRAKLLSTVMSLTRTRRFTELLKCWLGSQHVQSLVYRDVADALRRAVQAKQQRIHLRCAGAPQCVQ